MPIYAALKILTLLAVVAVQASPATVANISPTAKYAWSDTNGWSNFAPVNGGVAVCDDHLEGFAWAENCGWIKLGSHSGGGYFTYSNSNAADWGVNLNGAGLSGYGWSETAGWVNFNPANGGVTVNPATGVFDGYAWAENLGWLHFKGAAPPYNVLQVPNPRVSSILFDPTDPLKLRSAVDGSGIHLSSDGGAGWTPATTQPTDRRLKAAVLHPTTSATMFAATHGSGFFTSSDSGLTWTACANTGLGNLNVYSLAIDSAGLLYAGAKGGIFSSADCAVWSPKNASLPNSAGVYRQIVLALDPTSPQKIYAGIDGGGIYRSSDSGASWTAAVTQPAGLALRAVVIKPGDSSKLFAAGYGAGVFTSSDSGATWSACPATNLSNLNLIALTSDATGTLFAGTEAGVFVSTDGCATWSVLNNGLPN